MGSVLRMYLTESLSIDPISYIKATPKAIGSGHPVDQIDHLMPWAKLKTGRAAHNVYLAQLMNNGENEALRYLAKPSTTGIANMANVIRAIPRVVGRTAVKAPKPCWHPQTDTCGPSSDDSNGVCG